MLRRAQLEGKSLTPHRMLGRCSQLRDESHAEHTHRFDDGIEAGVPVLRKRFVEAGSCEAGLFGKFRHPAVCARGVHIVNYSGRSADVQRPLLESAYVLKGRARWRYPNGAWVRRTSAK